MILKDKIINYPKMFDARGTISANIVNKNSPFHSTDLSCAIIETTHFLNNESSLTERVYCILNNIVTVVMCTECSNLVKFRNGVYGYAKTCGTTCSNKSKLKHQNLKNNNMERFGVQYMKQRHISVGALENLNNPDWLYDQHYNKNQSIVEIAALCNVSESMVVKRFQTHNIKLKKLQSGAEKCILDYISSHYNTEIVCNTYKLIPPREIDIFLPECNLAIEVNGLYWHRPKQFKNKEAWVSYHLTKEQQCNKKGIRLQHIWYGHDNYRLQIDNAIRGTTENNLTLIYEEVNWP